MQLRFDPDQPWQLAAIDAVLDLFAGQPRRPADGSGNHLDLSEHSVLSNLQAVQTRSGLPCSTTLGEPEFGVEMETGTGKTYVLLRTLYELHARLGWRHAVLVVPTVAIREGLLAATRTLAAHLGGLYGDPPVTVQRWDSERPDIARRFAREPGLQVLVINVDALNKRTNLLHQRHDALGGRSPVGWIAGCRPVLVLDEPQRMEGDRARAGLEALDPLMTLRYSATHRDPRHLVYRLDPTQAAELGLVKQVEVLAVEESGGAPVEVVAVSTSPSGPTARVRVEVAGRDGPRPALRTVRPGADLEAITRRAAYRGLVVDDIDAQRRAVRFADGTERTLADGDHDRARRMEAQVRAAVEEHLERELRHQEQLGPRRLKVLTLFFLDRVATYATADGRVRRWFVEAWESLSTRPRYAALQPLPPIDQVHAGWFAQRRGAAIDTRGHSQADERVYSLILQDKERLLDPAEPLRFLFTHSALREGWDNPNVFVVCTLATTHSATRKRQEIGRGLRLPVLVDGTRCRDPAICQLTVVTNASYAQFCRDLQREHQKDWGPTSEARVARHGRSAEERRDAARWRTLTERLTWSLPLGESWVADAAARLAAAPAVRAGVALTRGVVDASGRGQIPTTALRDAPPSVTAVPDIAAALSRRTQLGRAACLEVLRASGRLSDALVDADALLNHAERAVSASLRATVGPALELSRGAAGWHARAATPPTDLVWADAPASLVLSSPVGPVRIQSVAAVGDRIWMRFRG